MPLPKRLTQDVHFTQIASCRFVPLHAEYVVDVWRWQVAAEVQAAKTLRRKLLAEAQSPSLDISYAQTLLKLFLKLFTALDSLSFSERCDSFNLFRGIPDENSAGSAKDNGGAH